MNSVPDSGSQADLLSRVVLAISSFRSDDEVLTLLDKVFAGDGSPFAAVVVVDSLTSGRIESAIRVLARDVVFWNADRNLGAAGNLARRMDLASACDADWCYSLNADGELNLDTVRELVRSAASGHQIGAVYPTRFRPNRGQSWEAPRLSFLPLSRGIRTVRDVTGDQDVLWGSSNGALYYLEPARLGIFVWEDLWHGWEDLSYAWLLWKHGWRQVLSARAAIIDPYEHRRVDLLGRGIYIHDKAPWIAYYTVRNLALFVRRTRAGPKGWAVLLLRCCQESLLTLLFKDRKWLRARFLLRGLLDGIVGRTGMTVDPEGPK